MTYKLRQTNGQASYRNEKRNHKISEKEIHLRNTYLFDEDISMSPPASRVSYCPSQIP